MARPSLVIGKAQALAKTRSSLGGDGKCLRLGHGDRGKAGAMPRLAMAMLSLGKVGGSRQGLGVGHVWWKKAKLGGSPRFRSWPWQHKAGWRVGQGLGVGHGKAKLGVWGVGVCVRGVVVVLKSKCWPWHCQAW